MFSLILMLVAYMASQAHGLATATVPHQHAKRDACSAGGPWVSPTVVGATAAGQAGPNNICETHWGTDYDIISNITAWTDGTKIRGIQFGYSSNGPGSVSQMYGNQDATSASLSLDQGEFFVSGTLWPESTRKKNSLRLGHIYLQTNKGKTLDIGKGKNQLGTATQLTTAQLGGGVLLGAVGTYGDDINGLGLFFLKQPVNNVEINNITYSQNPVGTNVGIQPVSLNTGHFFNNESATNVTWNFTGTFSTTTSYEYSQSSAVKFGDSLEVSVDDKVFGIGVSFSNTFTWSVTETTTESTTSTNTQGLNYGDTGSLLPGKGVDVQALAQKGQGNFPYSSNVTVFLKDGTTYSYNETGTLSNVQYSSTWTTTSENDSNDMPSGPTTPGASQATGTPQPVSSSPGNSTLARRRPY